MPNNQDSEANHPDSDLQARRVAEHLLEAIPSLTRLVRMASTESQGGGEGLTPTQIRALGLLVRGLRFPGELARKMDTSPASTSELVDALVRRGLVERCDEPGDRRCSRLQVTVAGLARYHAARRAALTALATLLTRLDPVALAALDHGLESLSRLPAEQPGGRGN